MEEKGSKLLPKLVQPRANAAAIQALWASDFATLRSKGYFNEGLEWKAIPDVQHGTQERPGKDGDMGEEEKAAPVPDVLHKAWTNGERRRAEVMYTCTCTQQ